MIDEKLTFSDYLTEKIKKATKMMGLIRIFVHPNAQVFKALSIAIVKPHIEYEIRSGAHI